MEKRDYRNQKRRLRFIIQLSIFLALTGFYENTSAQWSFTATLVYSGNCGGGYVALPALSVPTTGIPTQTQCLLYKNQVAAISVSGGGCTVSFKCSDCTGSDMYSASAQEPGSISNNGQLDGKPLFTPHHSEAYEDWARDYIQLLDSYGIKSILGQNITPHNNNNNNNNNKGGGSGKPKPPKPAPKTGDKPIDDLYGGQNFDPNVVDLTGKAGIVQLLTTPEEQKKRDEWINKNNVQLPGNTAAGIEESQPPASSYDAKTLLTMAQPVLEAAAIAVITLPEDAALLTVAAVGIAIPLAIEDIKAGIDIYNGRTPPSSAEILTNAANSMLKAYTLSAIGGAVGGGNIVVSKGIEMLGPIHDAIKIGWGGGE